MDGETIFMLTNSTREPFHHFCTPQGSVMVSFIERVPIVIAGAAADACVIGKGIDIESEVDEIAGCIPNNGRK
eukprot:scaffold479_cov97-Cylindrotheca_fusiformis.AAC.8